MSAVNRNTTGGAPVRIEIQVEDAPGPSRAGWRPCSTRRWPGTCPRTAPHTRSAAISRYWKLPLRYAVRNVSSMPVTRWSASRRNSQ